MRHVYFPLIRRGVSSDTSRFLTFLVSALFHEYIIIGIFRVFNFMGFLLMIINIPIISIQTALKGKIDTNLNNMLFWLGYAILGQPFAILLCHYQATKPI